MVNPRWPPFANPDAIITSYNVRGNITISPLSFIVIAFVVMKLWTCGGIPLSGSKRQKTKQNKNPLDRIKLEPFHVLLTL